MKNIDLTDITNYQTYQLRKMLSLLENGINALGFTETQLKTELEIRAALIDDEQNEWHNVHTEQNFL